MIIGLHIVAFFVVLLGGTVLVKALVSEDNFQQRQNWRLEAIAFAFTGIALYQLPYVIPSDSHCAPGKAAVPWGFFKGVVIAAAVTGLISVPCFLLVFGSRL
ncbi:MAG: hypothetical protein AAFU71_17895 [Cyanobacteria bacterium J06632_22]